jgi:isohexenylglutaconyl-CoA hydratase
VNVSVERRFAGGVLFVTLSDPASRNALGAEMVAGIDAAFEFAETTPEVRAVVLRGSGGTFCSGGNLDEFKRLMSAPAADRDADPIVRSNRRFGAALERIIRSTVPSIAVVEGAAVGGGLGLVAAADFAVARADARFGMPETTLGLPPAQIAPVVALKIGSARTRQLMLSARMLSAAEAFDIGLLDRVAATPGELAKNVADLLDGIGRCEPQAVRATKRILASSIQDGLALVLDDAAEEFARAMRSGRAAEGVAAAGERRAPPWRRKLADADEPSP